MIENLKLEIPEAHLLDKPNCYPIKVFEYGYVKLVDSMGDSYEPAGSARVSTGKGKLGPEKDKKLINRLASDSHTSTFESIELHFEVKLPIFVLREWDRHRTIRINETEISCEIESISTHDNDARCFRSQNEMSGRYVELPNEYYIPSKERIARQSKANAQGEAGAFDDWHQTYFQNKIAESIEASRRVYENLIEEGVERGLARVVLPFSQYTVVRLKADMLYWSKFLRLRLDGAAQNEIRQYSIALAHLINALYPELYPILEENMIHQGVLPRTEADLVAEYIRTTTTDPKLLKAADKLEMWKKNY